MTNKQYHFSLAVGLLLLVLGAVIAGQASTGVSLIGLGLAITILSVLTRNRVKGSDQMLLSGIPVDRTVLSESR